MVGNIVTVCIASRTKLQVLALDAPFRTVIAGIVGAEGAIRTDTTAAVAKDLIGEPITFSAASTSIRDILHGCIASRAKF